MDKERKKNTLKNDKKRRKHKKKTGVPNTPKEHKPDFKKKSPNLYT